MKGMKFKILILFLLIFKLSYSQSDELDGNKLTYVRNVIELFKQSNVDSISSVMNYPLRRAYPIPSVKNEIEFKLRFTEIFDKTLIDRIANSKIEQWSDVGWRGIMLDNGVIWIDSYQGQIIAVNYQSDFEKKQIQELIEKEREKLHSSLKTFESPIYKIMTQNYLIRIDKLSDYKYRYASWKIGEEESSKPDIIINNGELEFEGSGGNHVITFTNDIYTYKIYRNIIGEEDSPDTTLEVEKNGKIILTENGKLIAE
ncbi:hypothetical protein [Belliella aquatica]|uniref:Uncharacterized protein n=1 Tax=Belliella aquatica TaxID=1323734 RepID=A0ABQ1N2E1_9BACT|nr:hypothetical protein [Belliella aquatica]MCH7407111.1 hypothetical protein [Belliella aquatica]GGC52083.1 hypothetical protein GCM10010993_33200 [Belliella aquatica]